MNRIQPLFTLLLAMIVLLSAASVSAESRIVDEWFESASMQHQPSVMTCGHFTDKHSSQTIQCGTTISGPLDGCQSSCLMHIGLITEDHELAKPLEQTSAFPPFNPSSTFSIKSTLFRPPRA